MNSNILSLDVGEKHIGVARAGSIARLPEPLKTIEVDGTELEKISELIKAHNITDIVVGLPRNMNGEETQQSALTRRFVEILQTKTTVPIHFQDESLTSVQAEETFRASKKEYNKQDVDAQAAVLILQDYLDTLKNHYDNVA